MAQYSSAPIDAALSVPDHNDPDEPRGNRAGREKKQETQETVLLTKAIKMTIRHTHTYT